MTDVQVPERLGKYVIVRRLAYGGMGEVLLARLSGPDEFSRFVVIKRVLPQHVEDHAFITMFRDEARIMAQLYHGNIVQVIELGEADGQYYLVLEYVEGQSLAAVMRTLAPGERLGVAVAAYVLAEVARALDYAHNKRGADGAPLLLVHRDVTPSNVLLSYEGFVKLTDFGVARARARLGSTGAGVGTVKGKLAYVAPEVILGEQFDARSDIFALGAVAHEMLTGQRLFASDSDATTIWRITSEDVPPPSDTNPDVPQALDELVMRMLDKDPSQRPERGLEIAELAGAFTAGTPPAAEQLARMLAKLFRMSSRNRRTSIPPARARVLLIDQSRTLRALVRASIGSKYVVLEAASAQEARQLLRSERPAAVICQRQLEGTSGLELCREIRADPQLGSTPVVILSSDVSPSLVEQAETAGVSRVLPKKFDAHHLVETLDALIPDRG